MVLERGLNVAHQTKSQITAGNCENQPADKQQTLHTPAPLQLYDSHFNAKTQLQSVRVKAEKKKSQRVLLSFEVGAEKSLHGR